MKAIITKYLPFTNHKPSRIKASAEGVKSIIYTTNSLDCVEIIDGKNVQTDTNQIKAAKLFSLANNWPTNLASGQLPSGEWAHCFIPGQRDLHNLLNRAAAALETPNDLTPLEIQELIEDLTSNQ